VHDEQKLREIVAADPWLMSVLRAVRTCDPPDWAVGAGAVRNLVWDHLHGHTRRTPPADVDVVYFDPTDLSRASEQALAERLERLLPGVPWQVKNQAAVHLWYERRFGRSAPPIGSLAEGIGSWCEPATAVAVRLEPDDGVRVIAPCGLDDLFGLVWRRNPGTEMSPEEFRLRCREKDVARRWPRVRVVED
jgi:hypothetical protein